MITKNRRALRKLCRGYASVEVFKDSMFRTFYTSREPKMESFAGEIATLVEVTSSRSLFEWVRLLFLNLGLSLTFSHMRRVFFLAHVFKVYFRQGFDVVRFFIDFHA